MAKERSEAEILTQISEQLDELLAWPKRLRQFLSTIAWAAFGLGVVGIPFIMWLLE